MAFAPGGKAENAAKSVEAHRQAMPRFALHCKAGTIWVDGRNFLILYECVTFELL
jgi:hypothetical protein